jgi:ABC-2 type transport system permease protein
MPRWRKVSAVIRREYLSRVRTKAFWITTIAFPALILSFAVLPNLLAERSGGAYTVAVVTVNHALVEAADELAKTAAEKGKDDSGAVAITLREVAPAADVGAQRVELKKEIVGGTLSGAAILPADFLTTGKFEYLTTNTTAWRLMGRLQGLLGHAATRLRLERAGVAADRVDALTKDADLQPVRVGKDLSENAESGMQGFFLSYIFMFLLWFSVMIYGMYVMRGVLEEKSSRIVEVIVANLSPTELMVGKIAGVGAVGLTQYAIWTVVAMNLAVPGLLGAMAGSGTINIPPTLLIFFVVFFVLGYILHSTIYAAVGAAFNSEEEAHQMQSIVGWLIAIPFILMFPIINNPDSTLSVVLSLIPIFSPVLFFLRMSVQTPPLWQTVLCIGLLLVTIAAVARFAAAIYRVGILMYGKKPTLREVLRWVRA